MKTNVIPKSVTKRIEINFDLFTKLIKKPCLIDVQNILLIINTIRN
jgi:hypothetical protein